MRDKEVKEDQDDADAREEWFLPLAPPTLQSVLLSAFVERNTLETLGRYSGKGGLWNELAGAEATSFA